MTSPMGIERLRRANPFPATRIENEWRFDAIVATPGDPRLVDERASMSPRRGSARKTVVLGAAALLFLIAAPVAAVTGRLLFAPSKGQLEAERGGTLLPDSLRIVRTLERPKGVSWSVVTYRTTRYECLDVFATASESRAPAGAVGGCGLPPLRDQQVIVGGGGGKLAVGTHIFSVHAGRVAPRAATVRATFTDGSIAVDHPIGGVWLFVGPAEQSLLLVDALDAKGDVLGQLRLDR